MARDIAGKVIKYEDLLGKKVEIVRENVHAGQLKPLVGTYAGIKLADAALCYSLEEGATLPVDDASVVAV